MIADSQQLEAFLRKGAQELEPRRFRWLLLYLVAWILGIVGALATFTAFSMNSGNPQIGWIALGVSAVVFLIACFIASSIGAKLRDQFDQWRAELVQLLEERAEYKANSMLEQTLFDKSGISGAYYNRYSGSGFFKLGDIRLSSLSVNHEYKKTYYETVTSTDSQGRTQTEQVRKEKTIVDTIFYGMLLAIPAPLPHPTWLLLRHRDFEVPKGHKTLTVASPFLMNNFTISADDEFAGHRTLTPTMMHALWEYREKFKYVPRYSFKDGFLYIGIPSFWLDFGNRPSKWRSVTITSLDRIAKACQSSIDFVKTTSESLVPS